jgi:hypothetical protein
MEASVAGSPQRLNDAELRSQKEKRAPDIVRWEEWRKNAFDKHDLCLERAHEAAKWAAQSKDNECCAIWLDLAQSWRELAGHIESAACAASDTRAVGDRALSQFEIGSGLGGPLDLGVICHGIRGIV